MYRFFLLFCTILILPVQAFAQQGQPPVVIELFTSEFCGFCPPADEFLGELASKDGIIALACHVDYFPGEESFLAKSFCERRQDRYIDYMSNVNTNYTPQMVLNGHHDAIGSQPDKVNAAILKSRGEKIGRIGLTLLQANEYRLSLPVLSAPKNLDLILVSFRAPKTLTMKRGSNIGQRVTYTNVMHSVHNIGPWDGSSQVRSLTTASSPNIGGFAVLAQDRRTGRIFAAGMSGEL